MKTYQTFTKNGEIFLRLENPYGNSSRTDKLFYDDFEQTALSEATVYEDLLSKINDNEKND